MGTMFIVMVFLAMTIGHISSEGVCQNEVGNFPSKDTITYIMEEFVSGSNHFSLNLLRALNHTTNLFISPFSIWSSLVLLYLGSNGQTEKELQGILGVHNVDKSSVPFAFKIFEQLFNIEKTSPYSPSFNAVNKLFLQTCITLRPCLQHYVEDNLAFVDFFADPELARIVINLWVQEKTKDRIKEILPYQSVQKYTEFVVTSAVYFKGAWLQTFYPHLTSSKPFFKSPYEFIMTDAMVTKNTFFFAVSEELQCSALELPYVGGKISMVIMLPNNIGHGVKILVNSLTYARLESLEDDLFPREVLVQLPKFRIESSWQLSSPLYKMGLRDLFGSGSADLSGFAAGRNLDVNAIYHKTYVSVDEQGTEAAAGTSSAESRSARPNKIIKFVVDRPFVFYIRENHHGVILFMGIISNPSYVHKLS